jgi:hypothetical protein
VARLDDLQLTLDRGNAAKGSLAGLDEQYATAQALRNSAQPQINQYGTVSPFAVLADVVGKSQGRKQMRELAPQRQQARADISSSASALPMYNARSAQEGRDQTQENFGVTTGLAKAKAKALADQQALDNQSVLNKRTTEDRVNPATNLPERVEVGGDGELYTNGQRIANRNEWVNAPTKAETRAVGGASYGDKDLDKRGNTAYINLGNVSRVTDRANKLSVEDKAALNDPKSRFREVLLDTFSPAKASALIKEEFSGRSDEAKAFIQSVARMSAEERHELFGAALTQGEGESSKDFMARVEGLSLDPMLRTMRDSYDRNAGILRSVDELGGGRNYRGAVERAGYGDVWEASSTEGGIDFNDEAALDAYLEANS